MKISFEKYLQETDPQKIKKLEALQALYEYWNAQINVISRKDIENVDLHHVAHSLAIAQFIKFKPGTKIMDLGTGGGLPGIPLAIIFPDSHFTLIDSRKKKLKVIDDISSKLEITNVNTMHARAEEVRQKFHFVVSRAVARLDKLVSWCENKFLEKQINALPNGLICMKGGDLRDELKSLPRYFDPEVIPLSQYFDHPYFEEKHLVYIPF